MEGHVDKAVERGVKLIPTVVLVDEDDNVIRRIIGIMDKGELTKALK